MSAHKGITNALTSALNQRILVLDGAMGTMIQAEGLEEADYRGERFAQHLSLIHISEPTRQPATSRMPSSA